MKEWLLILIAGSCVSSTIYLAQIMLKLEKIQTQMEYRR